MKNKLDVKQRLFSKCTEYIEQRIESIQKKLEDIVESKGNETKSSAGDKHETGRTMMQLEEQKMTIQLYAARDVKYTLNQINLEHQNKEIGLGSLVICNGINYFISISAGQIKIDNDLYYAISLQSPIGHILMGKRKGELLKFNQKTIEILEVL